MPLTAIAGSDDSRSDQLGRVETTTSFFLEPVAIVGVVTEPKVADSVISEPSFGHIVAGCLSKGSSPQRLMHQVGCPLSHFQRLRSAGTGRIFWLLGAAGNFEPGPSRKTFQRFGKRHLLDLHHPAETIASFVTHPAAVRLPVRINVERWIVIFVKRAQTNVTATAMERFQADGVRHQIHQVGAGTDELLEIVASCQQGGAPVCSQECKSPDTRNSPPLCVTAR